MSVKIKLISAMICLCAIPILLFNLFTNSKLKDNSQNIFESQTKQAMSIECDIINNIVDDSLNCVKEIAGSDYVRKFTEDSNAQLLIKDSSFSQYFESTQRDIISVKKLHTYINMAFVVNNNGIIISSTNQDFLNKHTSEFENIFKDISYNNGVSSLKTVKISGKDTIVFFVMKAIYSDSNEVQGYYVQICDTDAIQKALSSLKLYDSTTSFIVDSEGYVFKSPYDSLIKYSDYINFSKIKDYIDSSMYDTQKTLANRFRQAQLANKKGSIYSQHLSSVNWIVFTYTNNTDIDSIFINSTKSVNIFSVYILVAVVVIVILFIHFFSKPIINLVEIVNKKRRGDQTARFTVTTADEFGQIGYALNSMLDDITDSEQRYRTIVEMTDNIVFEINFKKNSVFISNNFNQKFSFRAKTDSIQDSFFLKGRMHKDDKDRFQKDFDKILGSSNYLQGEYRFKNIYGDFAWILIRATKFFDREEVPTKIIGVMVDIDREKKSEMHLIQRANYDALTQVFNRENFLKTLSTEFEMSNSKNTLNAVLFIDLDDFKHFNDEYGHACGDEVLKYTADCLKEIVFDKGFVGRFGGDEFVVCLTNLQYFGDPGSISNEIIEALGKGFVSESTDKKLSIKCSIGIAFFNENGKNSEEVLNAADEAMYSIKKHGKSNFAYASGERNEIKNENNS